MGAGSSDAEAASFPRLLVANPFATILAANGRVAVAHGLDGDGETNLRAALQRAEPGAAIAEIILGQEEATIVLADAASPGAPTLEAWRGATSNFDVYLVDHGPDRPPTAADCYRDAVALVPPPRRTLDPNAVADHLLFAAVPGTGTYLAAIDRLGYGEHFHWRHGQARRRIFDPLVAVPRPQRSVLDGVDAALARAISRLPLAGSVALQLSGGVDSSLLQTYLPAGTPTVSGAIDSPEFAREVDYARQASRLLGTQHHVYKAAEGDFLDLLVDGIRQCGLPLRLPQPIYYDLSMQFPARYFVNGEFGDTLFGLKASRTYIDVFGQRRLLRAAQGLGLAALLPGAKARGLTRRFERLRRVEAPVADWEGWGARYGMYTNWQFAERALGMTTIRARIEARADYVARRFRSEERHGNPLLRHLEFGHVLNFYCNESVSQWRQLAHARQKTFLVPFGCRSVVAAALAIPCAQRFDAGGRLKYILKDLLKRRLPAFDVDASKAGGDLPLQRYFVGHAGLRNVPRLVDRDTAAAWQTAAAGTSAAADAPLREAFERFAMPDVIDRETAAATRAAPDWFTWTLLTLAIWRDAVLRDGTLAPGPGTRSVMPVPAASGTPLAAMAAGPMNAIA